MRSLTSKFLQLKQQQRANRFVQRAEDSGKANLLQQGPFSDEPKEHPTAGSPSWTYDYQRIEAQTLQIEERGEN